MVDIFVLETKFWGFKSLLGHLIIILARVDSHIKLLNLFHMLLLNNSFPNHNWKHWCQKLVLENCLIFGLNPRLTSKKVNKYLLGTRETLEIFKLYEMRSLLLKMYPLIHILFQNPRVNSRFEFKSSKTEWLPRRPFSFQKKRFPKKGVSFSFKYKNLPPQILFATTTEAFSDIIFQAASICNMPCHQKRWINGSITAAISEMYKNDSWNYRQTLAHKQTASYFHRDWSSNKENNEKIKEKAVRYGSSRWPSLIIIPDIVNNSMILSEVQKIGIPVLGLVNSHCTFEIDYPIFAQDQSFSSVYFFCSFLSTLIAKEMAYSQHKHYTLQNIQRQKKKKTNLFAPKENKKIFQEFIMQQKREAYLKDGFFFRNIIPAFKKKAKRHFSLSALFDVQFKMYKFAFVKEIQLIHKIFRWRPYDFRWTTIFWKIIHYSRKRRRLNFSWRYQFKEISAWHRQKFEKRRLIPGQIILQNENKKIFFLKQKQHSLFLGEKKRFASHLLRNFLWLSKKTPLYWKHRLLSPGRTILANNSYFWWSLQNIITDFRWQQHKHMLPKFLNIARKFFWSKNYKKHGATFFKRQKRKAWTKRVRYSQKYRPFKKKRYPWLEPKKKSFKY